MRIDIYVKGVTATIEEPQAQGRNKARQITLLGRF
jgi:hypothetical protein